MNPFKFPSKKTSLGMHAFNRLGMKLEVFVAGDLRACAQIRPDLPVAYGKTWEELEEALLANIELKGPVLAWTPYDFELKEVRLNALGKPVRNLEQNTLLFPMEKQEVLQKTFAALTRQHDEEENARRAAQQLEMANALTLAAGGVLTLDETKAIVPMKVSDLVRPIDNSDGYLRSGSSAYDVAVVVSVEPFVLVSVWGDMMWRSQKAENFEIVGTASKDDILAVNKRLAHEGMHPLTAPAEGT